ncbi:MAG: tRNA threonylcarbamoyladenosine dehydratase [Castellaniella sp.]|uniref:tRNA threonylcarbamoyladenosine dehydratase n=1 Tax=Castellaniella sp. TaxID=1955812 RepID=UPI00120F9722|nr:tRNA threonylcarbamoyladenosine dehydratase [Castellaniella sp.]TAN29713.1 MAG: tRNA threonylcarbamoyladenosine dehydratase [Castellaniella sp.]
MSDVPSFPPLLVATGGGGCAAEGCRIPSAAIGADEVDSARRFGGLDRLYGAGAFDALSRLHVVVAGIGGVGTWCVEALARSGVGALTLVDLDHIAESNVNRQVHALTSTLGQSKVLAMEARIRDIDPLCCVRCVDDFVDPGNLADILVTPPAPPALRSVLVDCTDQASAKIAMILHARALGWPLLVCGGAGGKTDPLALRAGDLADAVNDALLGRIRQELRKRHGYPKGGAAGGKPHHRPPRMGISCLWFDQPVVLPAAWTHEAAVPGLGGAPAATPAVAAPSGPQGLSCAGYGSVVTVTATMGMAAADWAIRKGLSTAS